MTASKPAPVSYGTLPFYGVNAFKFTNAQGAITYGRYQMLPVAGVQYRDDTEATNAAPDYLSAEMNQRISRALVEFKLVLQVAAQGDQLDDPSTAWPDD
ncbi:catalase [Bradyrhizobium sp. NBAIM08]|uniref:catalase n=1 Tax=Bradyrhizobium sp. NBAIM08 TaxID=2793815 RepID=UPI0023EE8DD9|nr:catalase [Bradyrhizobium sp. NBAIM08]MCA1479841.1 catalase [Bradyrhizobium sp. NBAIM08]